MVLIFLCRFRQYVWPAMPSWCLVPWIIEGWSWYNCRGIDKRTSYYPERLHPWTEVGNVPYVVDNGAGVFSKDPGEAARQVARWFSTDVDELKRYSRNALKLAQPEAVFDIVKDIHKLQQQPAAVTRIPYSLTSSFSYHI